METRDLHAAIGRVIVEFRLPGGSAGLRTTVTELPAIGFIDLAACAEIVTITVIPAFQSRAVDVGHIRLARHP